MPLPAPLKPVPARSSERPELAEEGVERDLARLASACCSVAFQSRLQLNVIRRGDTPKAGWDRGIVGTGAGQIPLDSLLSMIGTSC